VLLIVVLLAVVSGLGGLGIVAGGGVLLVGGIVLFVRRRRARARPSSSRSIAVVVTGAGVVLLLVGVVVTGAAPWSSTIFGPTGVQGFDADVAESGAGSADGSGASALTAAGLLETLPVKGRAPKTGYDRVGQFGTAWFDVDRNGCDTRNDILSRDLVDIVRSGPCKVLSGSLADPYTGSSIDFVRGNTTSLAVQIDHVVSLMDAWQSGAQQLDHEQRVALANDPLNLIAVDGSANAQKGASNAASWLPSNKAFRCDYAARQISVKAAYRLWVTSSEKSALARVLNGCPGEPALASTLASAHPERGVSGSSMETSPASSPAAAIPSGEPVPEVPTAPYRNCEAVRAAGAAPIHASDPGFDVHLDGDGDGVGCE
jgi:hypothetical protein